MDHFRTQYENYYNQEDYYWGLEPAAFLDELIQIMGDIKGLKALDIGCGEGKDIVYLAQKGFDAYGFDITESGIKKTQLLAENRNVDVHAFVADVNDFEINETFDLVYSTGTIQYLFDENIELFFEKIEKMVNVGGLVYFNVFVDKPFMPLPPDWDKEEKMWKTGQLFSYFSDWEIVKIDEIIFECNSSGIKHEHCMDTIIAKRRI